MKSFESNTNYTCEEVGRKFLMDEAETEELLKKARINFITKMVGSRRLSYMSRDSAQQFAKWITDRLEKERLMQVEKEDQARDRETEMLDRRLGASLDLAIRSAERAAKIDQAIERLIK